MMAEPTFAKVARTAAGHALGLRTPTAIPRLTIWCSFEPTAPAPAMFEPKFYVLLQGEKRLTVGGTSRLFKPGSFAVSTVNLPFTSQVTEASFDTPYVGVEIGLDAGIVASVLLDGPDLGRENAPAFAAEQVTDEVLEPVDRLLRLLASPHDIAALAPLFERELFYRLARGPVGGTLRKAVQSHTRFAQIRTAVDWICGHADEPMCVQDLATSVGMSVTSFHRHFKAVTAYSPLAYQKHIRLLDARERLVSGTTNVTTIAFASGYASAPQFSREYKRMFGVSPIQDAGFLKLEPATSSPNQRRPELLRLDR